MDSQNEKNNEENEEKNVVLNSTKPKYALWILMGIFAVATIIAGTYFYTIRPADESGKPAKPGIESPGGKIPPGPGEKIPSGTTIDSTNNNTLPNVPAATSLPDFIPTIRSYGGGGYRDFQLARLKELGVQFPQGPVNLNWGSIQPNRDTWNWDDTDSDMNKMAQNGLKNIAFILIPKQGIEWLGERSPSSVPQYAEAYERFAYEVVNRYRNHPASSGLVAVWGGSADVWDKQFPVTNPETIVTLLNAAYDGIKRADPSATVIGFNFATTITDRDFEEYFTRAFARSPKFDWFGVQSHGVYSTVVGVGDFTYSGVQGLINVRRFLDRNGYTNKPIWLNEGGFGFDGAKNGANEAGSGRIQAEQAAETYVVARSLNINLKGWVFFELFAKTLGEEDFAIMTPTNGNTTDPTPRKSFTALKILFSTIRFFDYRFDSKLSGEINRQTPAFVYRFIHKTTPNKKLWVAFSPRIEAEGSKYSGAGPIEPPVQNVTINIGQGMQANITEMLGSQLNPLQADSSGNITLQVGSSPIYIQVEG